MSPCERSKDFIFILAVLQDFISYVHFLFCEVSECINSIQVVL